MQKIPVVGLLVVGVAGTVTGAWEYNGYAQKVIESQEDHPLEGTVLRYDDPFEPAVPAEDWEVLK